MIFVVINDIESKAFFIKVIIPDPNFMGWHRVSFEFTRDTDREVV